MKIYYTYPHGLAKALTLSYDDGKIEDERLVAIFNKYGLKATFNLNYGIMTTEKPGSAKHPRLSADKINALYEGHEIATHTMTHPTIARCPMPMVCDEIMNDRKGLEKLTGRIIRGHAYPNGSYSKEIEELFKSVGIAYGRVVETTGTFELPENPMEWKATCHHNDPKLLDLAKFFVDFKKKQYLKLMYVWGHSYEFEDNNNWEVIEEFSKIIGGHDDIWYATNIEIIDYLDAAKRLVFSCDCTRVYNPSAISVWIAIDGEKIEEIKPGETKLLS